MGEELADGCGCVITAITISHTLATGHIEFSIFNVYGTAIKFNKNFQIERECTIFIIKNINFKIIALN